MGFFDALYADVAGFVELRALPGGRSEFFKPDDSAGRSKYLDAYPGYNHYFGVATRADDSSGALENCLHLPALFVDIDRKAGTDLSRVETCQCPPSAIVESGGGWHLYWLLREPLDLLTELSLACRRLQGLAAAVGGDPACAEPARILRRPGTLNFKYKPPRKVTVEFFEPERRYNPGDFDWLPETVEANGRTHAKLDLAKPVQVGGRNDALYRLGRSLHANQIADSVIVGTLRGLNHDPNVFEVPLPDAEVEQISVSVTTQPNRAEFTEEQPVVERPVVITMSTVERESVTWVWDRRIALGKLNLIAGEPGEGKSILTMDVAARLTTGTAFPDGGSGISGDVLLLSAEDGPSDTIAPRLDAAGADSSRVHLLRAIQRTDGKERHLDLSRDLEPLEYAIREYKPRVVIVDPLSAYLGRVDSWKDSQVRELLSPLAKMANDHQCAMVGVMHLSKSSGRKALHRFIGSIGFTAAARVAMVVAVDPEDDARRYLLPVKNNVSLPAETLAFRIVDQKIEWEPEPVKGITADSVMNGFPTDQAESKGAVEFVREILADGEWVPAKTLVAEARANGINPSALQRAKARLNVENRRVGFGENGVGSHGCRALRETPLFELKSMKPMQKA